MAARALWAPLVLAALAGCASPGHPDAAVPVSVPATVPVAQRIDALLPADVLLLGEQHDAAQHQSLARESVLALAQRGQLVALAIEMAESGRSTAQLRRTASESQVQAVLGWSDKGWPWAAYGPVVMSAVQAGVPVLGANLPRARMKDAMADVSLDVQLSKSAMQAQRQAVRNGHCGLLSESQIKPMTRIQIARDREMAHTVAQAVRAGGTVLLLAGSAHVDTVLGVPQHLPSDLRVRSVGMVAGDAPGPAFDSVWRTPALPAKDYCAGVRPAAPAR